MERASASPREGRVRWPGLLLAAALVTCWSSPASAQITAEAVPPLVAEGESVLLVAHKLPETLQVIYWYRDRVTPEKEIGHLILSSNQTVDGAASTGRETLLTNGSLLLRNASQGDAGPYLINVILADFSTKQASVSFQVLPPLPTPTVTSNNSSPTEGEGPVVLTCEPETPNTTYLWRRNGEILSDGDRLQLSDNGTLTLLTVLRADMGSYECETRNPVSTRRSHPLFLNITYGPDAPLISPSDTHFPPGANLSLSCHAASNPPAQYSWLVNGTLQAHSQELLLPNITTEASGTYACLAHNAVTGLNRTAVRNVTVLEPVTWPSVEVANTTVKEMDSVLLTCLFSGSEVSIRWLFNGQSLRLTDRTTLSGNNSTLAIEPVWREDAGDYQCEASNPVSTRRSNPVRLAVIRAPGSLSPSIQPHASAPISSASKTRFLFLSLIVSLLREVRLYFVVILISLLLMVEKWSLIGH
ncbi:carcinoembryonic antigen-related cell adhesion molecule 1 isoform X2 [Psammomys obesus]|uniref:carcinoembryonic antigen-related cell adhesion molecule 1 isoform X2 n=1 Tax=Psammomys obesus TaxID=48139 RepID=UPI0024531A1F|nr:carcinoembryonic antigen-related cell adhesion molecule 1 isoform X2 [Psammomys obesus]